MTADVVLIGCTKHKAKARCTARDMYARSDLFRRRRQYAESTGQPWAILSALHGVLHPDTEIDPYDYTIAQRRTAGGGGTTWAISVLQSCFRLADRHTAIGPSGHAVYVEPLTVEIHAGVAYVRTVELGCPAFATTIRLLHPVAHSGIGAQKAWYRQTQLAAAAAVNDLGPRRDVR